MKIKPNIYSRTRCIRQTRGNLNLTKMVGIFLVSTLVFIANMLQIQWRIQDFPDGVPTPELGAPYCYLVKCLPKTVMEMEEIGPRGGAYLVSTGFDSAIFFLKSCSEMSCSKSDFIGRPKAI